MHARVVRRDGQRLGGGDDNGAMAAHGHHGARPLGTMPSNADVLLPVGPVTEMDLNALNCTKAVNIWGAVKDAARAGIHCAIVCTGSLACV